MGINHNVNFIEHMSDFLIDEELLAAIDIGSNSFHLAIARVDHGEVKKVVSMSEKVQLAAGLDEHRNLSEVAQQRGLACLTRFVGRLGSVHPSRLRIVATNALRQAKNGHEFIEQAAQILPKPIEIIAGHEEARLIYLGVSHTLINSGRRLVIDIGGGSTEFIIGESFETSLIDSLQLGCISFTKKFFATGDISPKAFDKAVVAASKELSPIVHDFKKAGWDMAVGSSGTIKACRQIMSNMGLTDEQDNITRSGLNKLKDKLLKFKHVSELDFVGLKEDRRAVLPAGLAILYAIFENLDIDKLVYSDGALREGVMYDLLGRFRHEDVRDRSVQALMGRYHVDVKQAERVVQVSQVLFNSVKESLDFSNDDMDLLRRVSYVHEIGLAISHTNYHQHSAYLLKHSDIAGFSQIDQLNLSTMASHQTGKLKIDAKELVLKAGGERLLYLTVLLRLAVLINRTRSIKELPAIELYVKNDKKWQLQISSVNIAESPLLLAGLQDEKRQLSNWGIQLDIQLVVELQEKME